MADENIHTLDTAARDGKGAVTLLLYARSLHMIGRPTQTGWSNES